MVIQDVRGQYASEGTFYAFRDEAADGYDTIGWAGRGVWATSASSTA